MIRELLKSLFIVHWAMVYLFIVKLAKVKREEVEILLPYAPSHQQRLRNIQSRPTKFSFAILPRITHRSIALVTLIFSRSVQKGIVKG
jgi:hypothetical protein